MGGSSSQTIGQRYFAKLAVFIGNPIEKLIGINFDNRGWIYKPDNNESSFRIEKQNLYGDKEGGVAGFVDIQTGTAAQLPNVFYKANFPKVSGYPYQSYLVFRGLGSRVFPDGIIGGIAGIIMGGQHYSASFYLGNSGYMKEMLLWPQRVHVRNDGTGQWYDEKAEIVAIPSVSFIDDLKFSASHATVDGAAGIIIDSGFSKDDVLVVEKTKGLTYKAWSNWSADISSENSWTNEISVTSNAGVSKFWEGYFETDDEAEEYASNHYFTLTGSTSYKFWIDDIPPDDNRGGVSLRVYKGGVSDLNPIHKIREILTDDTAMHKPESDVNDINFRKAADVLYEEKIGVSWSVTEKSCLDAINELCGHIEAGVRINRQTGLYEMVLFRDDWFDESEIHILPQNKIKSLQLDVQNADESINQLNVSYYNRDAIKNSSFSIAENASIKNLQGRVNAETADFPYFMNQRNAAVVAQWKLKQMSTPVWQGTFTTGFYEARKWNRYDLLKLAWPRKWSGTILVRIMKINLGTGTDVSIDFVEVVPYSSDLSSNIVIDTPVDTSPKPPQPALFKAFELSYFEAVQLNGQKAVDDALAYNPDAGYVAVIAKRPQNNSLSALMYSDAGNGFERAGAIAYSETAELDQAISQTNTAFIVKNVGNLGAIRLGTQITIASEIMVYQSYDAETSLLTVKRGALDSIPQIHSAGSVLYFADDFITVDPTEYVTSEVVDVKALTTTPSGILDIEDVDAQQVEIHARAIRPYPPANIKINEEYWPIELETDLVLTWADRNRVQQTGGSILGWFDSGVMIEQDTQTHLILTQFDENDVELATTNANVTGTTNYTMPISLMQADTRTVEIVLKTVRDGYECLNPFIHIVELSQFFSAPYDLVVEFKKDETNRLELNWKLDGFADEQRYYCSETPINLESLPVPKAFLVGDVRAYTDSDSIEIGRKKYIAISSIKNSVEKVSTQAFAYCLPSQPKVWSEFKQNFMDNFGTNWTARNGALISNNALKLVRSSAQRVEAEHSDKFHFSNSDDVTIRFKAKISSFASDRRVLFTTRIDGSGAKNWCIYVVPNGIQFFLWRSDTAGEIINKTWSSAYQFNEETEFSLERKNMVWKLYINGNLLGDSVTQNMDYTPIDQKLTIGSEFNTDGSDDKSRDLDGEISMFQILSLAIGGGGSTTPRI